MSRPDHVGSVISYVLLTYKLPYLSETNDSTSASSGKHDSLIHLVQSVDPKWLTTTGERFVV